MRRFGKVLIALTILMVLFFASTNVWVVASTASKVFNDPDSIPTHRVALVLGTSHRTASGSSNPFFENRINAAADLYTRNKIDHFILSGDNRSRYYNEPNEMRKALIARGVPSNAITLDYAGLRTLDSVVRSKEIFGQDKITIITQPFHSYRAVFICRFYDIEAVAMAAGEPDYDYSFKVRFREYFARTKAVLDLYVFKTAPKHLGKKEPINI